MYDLGSLMKGTLSKNSHLVLEGANPPLRHLRNMRDVSSSANTARPKKKED